MATNPIIKPLNKVVVAGTPVYYSYRIKTATNCYPTRFVTKDTTDAEIKVCGATDTPLGVLGYEQASSVFYPENIDTSYAAGDEAPVIIGTEGVQLLTLAAGQTVNSGDMLVIVDAGCVAKAGATPDVTKIVAVALESITTTATTAKILARRI